MKIRFISIENIRSLDKKTKINTLLEYIQKNEIVLINGKLSNKEEADLIRATMNTINKKFKEELFMEFNGIEMAYLTDDSLKNKNIILKIKNKIIDILDDKKTSGITIIGPTTLIREIKQYPSYLELKIK